MAKLRKFSAYRRYTGQSYTRISKYREKSYVRTRPTVIIVKYDMGDASKTYTHIVHLVSNERLQIRHNSIESARQSANKLLEAKLGKNGYHFRIRMYPHHVLRENPLASGAGADRMSTGMQKAFGKPIGTAARVCAGKQLFTLKVNKQDLQTARDAMTRAAHKLPCSTSIIVEEAKV